MVGASARLDADGVALTTADDAALLRLRFTAWGREDAPITISPVEPELGACTTEEDLMGACIQRLEYAYPGVTEWWVSLNDGLEQGWTVAEPPLGEGALMVEVAVEDALAIEGEAGAATMTDAQGGAWQISAVSAWDADGVLLPTWLEVGADTLRVVVDDTDAAYPITIDPIYSTAGWVVYGENTTYFGTRLASVGDVNGDGYDDALFGVPLVGHATGQAFVYYGSAAGLPTTADVALEAQEPRGAFSADLAGAGDVNGDGYDDIIISSSSATTYGAVLYYGSADGVATSPDVGLAAVSGSTAFGSGVSTAGDVNNDGYDDVIVGASESNSYTGQAFLYLGSAFGLATTPATTLNGPTTSSWFGRYVSSAGDVNNDGYDDVIVSAYQYSSYAGRVFVYHGTSSGVETVGTAIESPSASSYFGQGISRAGDVNSDGYDDIIVGAPRYSSSTGRAYVYHGSSAGVGTSIATTLSGYSSGDYFGFGVADAGDINLDGYDDVAVGSYYYSSGLGRLTVYYGSSSGTISVAAVAVSGTSTTGMGYDLDAGDFNGDTWTDLLVGAYLANNSTGAAMVYAGSAAGLTTTAATTINSPAKQLLYPALTAAGDMNGDGYDDVALGCGTCSSSTGLAYVFFGGPDGPDIYAGAKLEGSGGAYAFGESIAGAGDLNADGYDDLIVGESNNSGGKAYVFFGSADGVSSTLSAVMSAESSNNHFGYSVDGAGDVNADGYDDVIVGAWGAGSYYTGEAYVYHGNSSGVATSRSRELSVSTESYLGWKVAGAGDVNADGYDDVALATYYNSGRVYVFHGGSSLSTTATTILSGETYNDYFGSALSACDLNGDGYNDLVVGAHNYDANAGRVYAYHGTASGLSSVPTSIFTGDASDWLGRTLDCVPSLNGDIYDDLVLSSYYHNAYVGAMWVYYGSGSGLAASPDITVDGTDSEFYFGYAVSGAGDVNGDGYEDVLVGGYETAWIYFGYDDGSSGCSDGGGPSLWYSDEDGDGHGTNVSTLTACTTPIGYADNADDCDDSAADIYPGAPEACDLIDNDCDGAADEDVVIQTFYLDSDDDGWGVDSSTFSDCIAPAGYTANVGDCDDADATVNPSAAEVCDGADNNCDGAVDGADAADPATWYRDADGDGFGDATTTTAACDAPEGYLSDARDCDDASAAVSPSAPERCDGADNNCDGATDETGALGMVSWYADADADGYGDPGLAQTACTQPDGYVADATDCDDAAGTTHPGAIESCNNLDDDCDGSADEGAPADAPLWYQDADNDGYGTLSVVQYACVNPVGYVSDNSDCNDASTSIFPGAVETCNDTDDDCDGTTDEDAIDVSTYYQDGDSDGFGSLTATTACTQPDGYVDNSADCDDARSGTYPGATEVCGGADEDCDGLTDEPGATGTTTFWYDGDGDGYGSAADAYDACAQPAGYAGNDDDCDDTDASVHPDATEVWYDGIDQDCDANDSDQDGDGYALADDCDDTDASVWADCDTTSGDSDPPQGDSGSPEGDSGSPGGDSGPSGDPPDTGKASTEGCGCASSPGGLTAAWLMGLCALLYRRRATS